MDLAEYFRHLGQDVERAWRTLRSDEDAFSAAATKVLEELTLPSLDAQALLAALGRAAWLPAQEDPDATFGEPPITVYRSRDFFVSVLFWFDGTTTIHEHSFSGAFLVLEGSSIHVRHEFLPRERVSRRLQFGDVAFRDAELLRRGAVRPILAGGHGAHSLFHLERPSVTLVVRTYNEAWASPQLDYYRPGMAFDPARRHSDVKRQLQVVRAARELDEAAGLELARSLIASGDPFFGVCLLEDWFRSGDRGDALSMLVDAYGQTHRDLGTMVASVYQERLRELNLIVRRSMLRDPRQRMFLAMLLTLPTPASRLDVLRSAYPSEDPAAFVATMLRELSSPELRGTSGLTLTPDEMATLERALDQGGQLTAEDERQLATRMRQSDVLRRLFS